MMLVTDSISSWLVRYPTRASLGDISAEQDRVHGAVLASQLTRLVQLLSGLDLSCRSPAPAGLSQCKWVCPAAKQAPIAGQS